MLAAGMGSRFGGPKQLFPLGPSGESLIQLHLRQALNAGFQQAVIVTRSQLLPQIREQVRQLNLPSSFTTHLVCQDQTPFPGLEKDPAAPRSKPWGTAHAVWCARSHHQGTWVSVNADDFYGHDILARIAHKFSDSPPPGAAVISFPLGNTLTPNGEVNRALCHCTPKAELLSLEETKGLKHHGDRVTDDQGRLFSPDFPVSLNLWLLPPALIDHAGSWLASQRDQASENPNFEAGLPDMINHCHPLLQKGSPLIWPLGKTWTGITHPEDAGQARKSIQDAMAQMS